MDVQNARGSNTVERVLLILSVVVIVLQLWAIGSS